MLAEMAMNNVITLYWELCGSLFYWSVCCVSSIQPYTVDAVDEEIDFDFLITVDGKFRKLRANPEKSSI